MFSTITQPEDYELISTLYGIVNNHTVEKTVFNGNALEKKAYTMLYSAYSRSRPNVLQLLKESNTKKIIEDYEWRLSVVTNTLSNAYKNYKIEYNDKTILGQSVKMTIGSNVLVKTDAYYSIENSEKIYSGIYHGYRLLNIKEIIGNAGSSSISKDSTTVDDVQNYKWIPYLFDFEVPNFEETSEDDSKFLSLVTKKISREEFQKFLTENFLEGFDHPLFERFKIIVDVANQVVTTLSFDMEQRIKRLNNILDSVYKEVNFSLECEEGTRKEIEELKLASEQYKLRREQWDLNISGKFYSKYDGKKTLLEYLVNAVNGVHSGSFISLETLKTFWLPDEQLIEYVSSLYGEEINNLNKFCWLVDEGRTNYQAHLAARPLYAKADEMINYPFVALALSKTGEIAEVVGLGNLINKIVVEKQPPTIDDLKFVAEVYSKDSTESIAFVHTKEIKPTTRAKRTVKHEQFFIRGISEPVSKEEYARMAPNRLISSFI